MRLVLQIFLAFFIFFESKGQSVGGFNGGLNGLKKYFDSKFKNIEMDMSMQELKNKVKLIIQF